MSDRCNQKWQVITVAGKLTTQWNEKRNCAIWVVTSLDRKTPLILEAGDVVTLSKKYEPILPDAPLIEEKIWHGVVEAKHLKTNSDIYAASREAPCPPQWYGGNICARVTYLDPIRDTVGTTPQKGKALVLSG